MFGDEPAITEWSWVVMWRIYADRGESADRDHIIRKPNSTIVLLFIKNISKFFTKLTSSKAFFKTLACVSAWFKDFKIQIDVLEADFVCHKSNVNSFTSQNSKS